ncbi:YfgM family protein [Zophobihabitans entericus]|uniref:Ancillary SecYEG translocon subunit n=1 Tax=Zophobihabitans entericus TaxID=1635327 RepID=A0A6G9I952_9GAMM|nr:tetratricopeptide repeat protein [Zophobihabitans entericus]QIQ20746.1 tetratricopeptide repeat protein [Zophobihabitans entericus]
MSYDSTGEEQLSEVKDFLKKFWKLILLVLVIGLVAIWGWRYWQSHQTGKLEQASDTYEKLVSRLDATQPDSVKELVSFSKETNNVYGAFSAMKAAQYYVEILKDYAGAQALLEDALKKTDETAIQSIINVRIARLQYQQGQNEESLKTLDKVKDVSWAAVANDLRGDVLVSLERYSDALAAYGLALNSEPTSELVTAINTKLNQVEYLKAKQAIDDEAKAAEAAKEAERVAAEQAKQAELEAQQEQQTQQEPAQAE